MLVPWLGIVLCYVKMDVRYGIFTALLSSYHFLISLFHIWVEEQAVVPDDIGDNVGGDKNGANQTEADVEQEEQLEEGMF